MAIPKDKGRIQFTISLEVYEMFEWLFQLEKEKKNKDVRYSSDVISKMIREEYQRKEEEINKLKEIYALQEELKSDEKDGE